MLGSALKTIVDSLTNDSMGDTAFYAMLNAAKDATEGERNWEFLKKLDTTKTLSAGATSSTTFALPTDFGIPLRVSVGSESSHRSLISQGDSRILRDESGSWFIDWINSTYSFTGTEGTGGTVYLLYTRFSPDIISSTSPVWPDRFHRSLAYDVAKQWFYQNAGERQFNWSGEMAAEARRLHDAMVTWDERLKSLSINNSPVDMSFAAQID